MTKYIHSGSCYFILGVLLVAGKMSFSSQSPDFHSRSASPEDRLHENNTIERRLNVSGLASENDTDSSGNKYNSRDGLLHTFYTGNKKRQNLRQRSLSVGSPALSRYETFIIAYGGRRKAKEESAKKHIDWFDQENNNKQKQSSHSSGTQTPPGARTPETTTTTTTTTVTATTTSIL